MKMNCKIINAHCAAVYIEDSEGTTYSVTVYSYNTPVLHYDGQTDTLHRLWDSWSATTQRDINNVFPALKMIKTKWQKMEVEGM